MEAFDKRLCPLYHGVVELTKNHKPLAKLGGDDEEEILPDGSSRRAEGLAPGAEGIVLQVRVGAFETLVIMHFRAFQVADAMLSEFMPQSGQQVDIHM